MNTLIFLVSGLLSLTSTLCLIILIYKSSISAQTEIVKWKMLSLIMAIYLLINTLYFLKLIPPVPLALDKGLVAYNIEKKGAAYKVTYEVDEWYLFWRDHKADFNKQTNKPVYVFTSVFAPTDLKKKIYHRWKWFDENLNEWQTVDKIGYEIVGGRDTGFRGFTYKNNVTAGEWKVEVITEEELVLGVVDFNININKDAKAEKLITRTF